MPGDPLLPPDSNPTSLRATASSSSPSTGDATQSTDAGLAPNVAAGLSAISTLLGGLVFIILEKKNQFVRLWAMQSIFRSDVAGGRRRCQHHRQHSDPYLLPAGSRLVVGGLVVYLAFAVVWVVTMVKAFNGQFREVPFIGKLAREPLAKMPSA